jgi:hypothetical protein
MLMHADVCGMAQVRVGSVAARVVVPLANPSDQPLVFELLVTPPVREQPLSDLQVSVYAPLSC